jgi:hypothetical protein
MGQRQNRDGRVSTIIPVLGSTDAEALIPVLNRVPWGSGTPALSSLTISGNILQE